MSPAIRRMPVTIAAVLAVLSCFQGTALASRVHEGSNRPGAVPTIGEIQRVSEHSVGRETGRNANRSTQTMRITVTAGERIVVYELNDSRASRELYAQLPLTLAVENYAGIEKIFYPPEKLATTDTPRVEAASAGTLAYYAPWGDVVMFHAEFGSAPGLYELGHAVSGREQIQELSGTIRIDRGGE